MIRTYNVDLCSARIIPVIDDGKHEIIYIPHELFLSLLKGDLPKLQKADEAFSSAVQGKDYYIAEFKNVGAHAIIEEFVTDNSMDLDEPLPIHKSFCLKGNKDNQ